jgi:nucleotide-binding universal stress UspA family protein
MSYRTLLLHLDMARPSHTRIDVAVRLAALHGARIVGLFSPHADEPPSYYLNRELGERLDRLRTLQTRIAMELESHLKESAARVQVPVDWTVARQHPNQAVPLHARHADLTLVGQNDPEDRYGFVALGFVAHVMQQAGRPVLVLPRPSEEIGGMRSTLGKRPLLAWDCSRSATRALHDAIPLLRQAEHCDLLSINARYDDELLMWRPGEEIAGVLATHGVSCTVHQRECIQTRDVGAALLGYAREFESDLIVAGAYGHARFGEWVLGGVTRHLLDVSPLPVLFSH